MEHYIKKYHAQEESLESLKASDSNPEETSKDEDPKMKPCLKSATCKGRKGQGVEGFPPLELTMLDPLTGNSKELFCMTLMGDQQMIEKLSPPGFDIKAKEALADATLDAIQLPGTSLSKVADNTGDLVGTLKEITEDQRYDWMSDRPQKDSLCKASSRTSLLSIQTKEGPCKHLTEFAGLPKEMFENQVHTFSAIFSKLHGGPETIHAWSCCNWFPRLGKNTLENYLALHLHLVTLCMDESWTYAQKLLKHYASKLAQFRKTSTSCLQCLIKIYIFLCDTRKNDF